MAIKMYSTVWCPDCYRAKRFLKKHGIAFEQIDISHNQQAAELVIRQNNGKRRVPTFEINGAFYGNPRLDELGRLLGIL